MKHDPMPLLLSLRAAFGLDRPVPDAYRLPRGMDGPAMARAAAAALERLLDAGLGPALAPLADLQVAPGLEASVGRARLLAELVLNLDEPGRINQGWKGTCAVTCVEVHLAERHPELYIDLVAGLLSPSGQARTAGGDHLRRDEERLAWDPAEGERGPLSRLVQAACMELADPELDYDNVADAMAAPDGPAGQAGEGITLAAFDRLLESLTGQPWSWLSLGHAALVRSWGLDPATMPDLRRDAPGILQRCADAGATCFATLRPPRLARPQDAGPEVDALLARAHKVRVLGIDAERDRVLYEDPIDPDRPWILGPRSELVDRLGRCTLPRADFLDLVVELSYPPEFGPVLGS